MPDNGARSGLDFLHIKLFEHLFFRLVVCLLLATLAEKPLDELKEFFPFLLGFLVGGLLLAQSEL